MLGRGDCLFIPAFYYYQFAAETTSYADKVGKYNSSAVVVNLNYQANSDLLNAFEGLVEEEILL